MAMAGMLMARLRASAHEMARPRVTPIARSTGPSSHSRRLCRASSCAMNSATTAPTTTPRTLAACPSYRMASRAGDVSSSPSAGVRFIGRSANAFLIAAVAAPASSSAASTSTPENPPAWRVASASPGPT
jgi:hypothetical protein